MDSAERMTHILADHRCPDYCGLWFAIVLQAAAKTPDGRRFSDTQFNYRRVDRRVLTRYDLYLCREPDDSSIS